MKNTEKAFNKVYKAYTKFRWSDMEIFLDGDVSLKRSSYLKMECKESKADKNSQSTY